jgi:hypothetical protein
MILGGVFISYFQNPYLIYALQVLSGNWGGVQPIGVDQYSYVVGAIFAVILNTITIAAIVKGAIELTIIRKGKSMNIKNAFNVRDQLALKGIMDILKPLTNNLNASDLQKVEDDIWNCFIDADKKWESEFIPAIMPGAAGAEFLKRLKSGPT